MRVLVCGGREFSDALMLGEHLDAFHRSNPITVIIHGDARGADTLAAQWARAHGIEVVAFPANWNLHGKSAGPIRNRQMLDEGKPDMVVAFPGGAGTANMVDQSRKAGVRTHVIGEAERTLGLFE